jgi:TAG lipase/steryl ester hydrolase/phospholipase A2/LPA acyltransferase
MLPLLMCCWPVLCTPLALYQVNKHTILNVPSVIISCVICVGIMKPAALLSKSDNGAIVPYLMKDMRWVDGSVTSDIPRQRVASLFNVTNWIVSQVNPHIVPCELPVSAYPFL